MSSEKQTVHRLILTTFPNLTKSFSSSTNHDSSELLWDDEFDDDDYDLFGADPLQKSKGDFDEDFGGGGVYGCVDSIRFRTCTYCVETWPKSISRALYVSY